MTKRREIMNEKCCQNRESNAVLQTDKEAKRRIVS